MASDRELQTLEENEEDVLAVNTSMRVEGYRYEPRRVPAPILSDDSSTEGSDNDESEGEMGDDRLGNTDWYVLCVFFALFFYGLLFSPFKITAFNLFIEVEYANARAVFRVTHDTTDPRPTPDILACHCRWG